MKHKWTTREILEDVATSLVVDGMIPVVEADDRSLDRAIDKLKGKLRVFEGERARRDTYHGG